MSLFTISDLHLSTGDKTNKSMEVFGARWEGYTNKLQKNWNAVVTDKDSVVIAGDISWALKLDEAQSDLKFLDSLPGTKYIGKGNHDFWWSTASKMNAVFDELNIKTIKFLYNNAFVIENFVVCGSRGWFTDRSQQNVVGEVDYQKIVNREAARLKISLEEGKKLRDETGFPIIVFLHFPPIWNDFSCNEILELLREYNVKKCFFGHIHGTYNIPRKFTFDGIEMILTSADFLNFCPIPVFSDFLC